MASTFVGDYTDMEGKVVTLEAPKKVFFEKELTNKEGKKEVAFYTMVKKEYFTAWNIITLIANKKKKDFLSVEAK